MAKIGKTEASMIRNLMNEQGWQILQGLLADRIRDIQAEKIVGTNEFDTLRLLHTNQGKVDGLSNFFASLDEGAFE